MTRLSKWLKKLEKLHPKQIDLGLERVHGVATALNLLPWKIPTITVAGTNGKGSCTVLTSMILTEAGYKTGAYFSPHLLRFNERITINSLEVSDDLICDAFTKIDNARGDISLSYFEFSTLAALLIFKNAHVDFAVLEVGLGGRLDAVNIIDAEIAVITNIDLDHQEWLGNTREKIALEKAGVLRPNKPTVCGDIDPPATLIQYAKQLQTPLFLINREFSYKKEKNKWHWTSTLFETILSDLPIPSILLSNAAIVLQVIGLLQKNYSIAQIAIINALQKINLAGRYERIKYTPLHIFDVAHNPHATQLLAKRLSEENISGKIIAVFSMLEDKDITSSIKPLSNIIDHWYIAPIEHERAASLSKHCQALKENQINALTACSSLHDAYQKCLLNSTTEDLIVIFGSFFTVAAVKMIIKDKISIKFCVQKTQELEII
jgi:dihydrofolate synthase/folylpolyglutamate synthase